MTSPIDAAIQAYVDSLDIDSWAPLSSTERDLVRRTLGRVNPQSSDTSPVLEAA